MAFLYVQYKTREHRRSIHQVVTQEATLVWSSQKNKIREKHLEFFVTPKAYKKQCSTNTVLEDLNQTATQNPRHSQFLAGL